MQELLFSNQQIDLRAVRDRLGTVFGTIRDEPRLDPASQFVRSFVSSQTYDQVSSRAFVKLTSRYRSWDAIADAPLGDIEEVLAGATRAEDKAQNLQGALRKIRASAGAIDLEFLADLPVEQGLFWLEQIYGVGRKIAAATLNFSTLRKRTFVVDTHVWRVMRRFGFVGPKADELAVYHAVMAASSGLDADDLYELHWHVKRLGQKTCTHSRVACVSCPLSDICLKRIEKAAVVVTQQCGLSA